MHHQKIRGNKNELKSWLIMVSDNMRIKDK